MSTLYLLWFILSGLPIIGYPMILVANLMSFAGHRPKNTPRLTFVMMRSFLWLTTLYPITYFFALHKYRNTSAEAHFIWAGLILLHLVIIFIAFKGWTTIEKKNKKPSSPVPPKEDRF